MATEGIQRKRPVQDKRPSRIEILVDNYREARGEGTKLAQSFFADITFAVALLASAIGGGVIANEPKLLLLIPFIVGGFALYAIQKLRVNNLITSYMIYLEKAINEEYSTPIMIWNSEFIRRNVSPSRQSKWSQAMLIFGVILVSVLYFSICLWPSSQNHIFFQQNPRMEYVYIVGCMILYVFDLVGIVSTILVTRKYSVEYIESLVRQRAIEYSEIKKK